MTTGTEENESVVVPSLTDDDCEDCSTPLLQWIMVSLVSVLSMLIVLSYMWIIVTVARTHSLHTASNCFLASLAVSIVIMGSAGPPSVIFFTAIKTFTYPLIFTMTWMISLAFIGYFLNAVLLAADKWFKISRPFLYARVVTRSKCTVCLSVIWATAVLLSLLTAIVYTMNLNLTDIENDIFGSFSVVSVVFGYSVVLPGVIVITALNFCINRIARKQARAIAPQRQEQRIDDPENAAVSDENRFQPDFRAIHTKSTRQFSIFLLFFPITWLPLAPLCHVVYAYETTAENSAFVVVLMIYFSATIFQSSFGTLILTLLQKEYRQILKKNVRTVLEKMHCIKRR